MATGGNVLAIGPPQLKLREIPAYPISSVDRTAPHLPVYDFYRFAPAFALKIEVYIVRWRRSHAP